MPPTPPNDTDAEAERVQLELLRGAGAARRATLACSLSRSVIELSRRGIRRSHPQATEEELRALFVELHYGPDLAAGWRAYLARR